MADRKKNPKGGKGVRVSFNFSWLYLLLILGIGWLLFNNQQSAEPQKIEWQQVQTMASSGDIEEIVFIRNDIRGEIKVRPERLAKYADEFPGGNVPRRAPHFYFLVSAKFDPEASFAALNENLPVGDQFKVVMQNADHTWAELAQWIFPTLLLILFWVWMFRGMNRGAGGAGGGMGNPFNVGKATGKLADKDEVKVTFKDVAGLYVPQESEEIYGPRRQDSEGRAPRRPSGHRQDAPRQGRRRRSERSVLLHLRFRLRGNVRRRGRVPCTRSFPPGEGEGPLHRFHRRNRRCGPRKSQERRFYLQ